MALVGLFVAAGLAFAVVYVAFPRVLLRTYETVHRARAGFTAGSARVNGWQVPYIQAGQHDDRETVLLIHGFGDSKDRFVDLAKGLTDDFRIIAPDLPGFGESANRSDQKFSADFYRNVIIGFLDELEIESAHLVGYSMGGLLSAKVAAASPQRVRTLTLLAPAGLPGDELSEVDRLLESGQTPLIYRNRESLERLLTLNFNGDFYVPDFAFRALLAEGKERADLHELIFDQLFDRNAITEFQQQVASIDVPTIVIWGMEDRILDASSADRWQEVNPRIKVAKLSGVGHALIHQRIDEIRTAIRDHARGDRKAN